MWLNSYLILYVVLKWRQFEMPTQKRRIQERERQFKEAAKGSTSLQSWLRKKQATGEAETLQDYKDDTVG